MTKLDDLKLYTTKDVGSEVSVIKYAFDRKHELEREIENLIRKYEDDTGFFIDLIRFQRDITLPIKGPKFTSLNITITTEQHP